MSLVVEPPANAALNRREWTGLDNEIGVSGLSIEILPVKFPVSTELT